MKICQNLKKCCLFSPFQLCDFRVAELRSTIKVLQVVCGGVCLSWGKQHCKFRFCSLYFQRIHHQRVSQWLKNSKELRLVSLKTSRQKYLDLKILGRGYVCLHVCTCQCLNCSKVHYMDFCVNSYSFFCRTKEGQNICKMNSTVPYWKIFQSNMLHFKDFFSCFYGLRLLEVGIFIEVYPVFGMFLMISIHMFVYYSSSSWKGLFQYFKIYFSASKNQYPNSVGFFFSY